MKIAIVHNEYKHFSGEEAVVKDQTRLLEDNGHEVCFFIRRSSDIPKMRLGKLRAFFSGIYSCSAKREFRRFLMKERPDIVHVHNLFPLISPSILPVCTKANIPVVMTVHNYRLLCPTGLFYCHGQICEKCASGKEWHCIQQNCNSSYFKSVGYALRNWFARKRRFYLDHVAHFLALTEFQKRKLVEYGFPEDKISVIPNMVHAIPESSQQNDSLPGYVAYAGRLSEEKGIDLIIEAARLLPEIPFKLAGNGADEFRDIAPVNVEFLGYVSKERLPEFYAGCHLAVMASRWYEGFPTVLPELMCMRKAVIVPDVGGFPEIIQDNFNGLLFRAGDIKDLAGKIKVLFENNSMRDTFTNNGYNKYKDNYTPMVYYSRLMKIYNETIGE